MTRIALIAATALLVAAGTANAQSSTAGANQGRCWDSATNQVRDMGMTGSTSTGSTAGTLSDRTGGSGSGSGIAPSTGAGGSTSSLPGMGSTAQTRPVGLAECR